MQLNNAPMGIPACSPCCFFDQNSHEKWRRERIYFLHKRIREVYTDRHRHARHVTVTLGGMNGRKRLGREFSPWTKGTKAGRPLKQYRKNGEVFYFFN